MTTRDLIGRGAETKIIDSIVDHVKDRGGSLIVRGEPGIGKSALLGHARQRALDLGAQVFATVGVESEAELTFAGLHQLLLPIRGLLPSLPAPQRRALEAAFGIGAEDQRDIFRVAMAALNLLTSAAESEPIVVLADDAHWLDHSSVRVLAFIARRLEHEAMVLVAAVRAGYRTAFDDASLPALDLERLSPVAAGQLVDLQAPTLHPIVRARVLTEAAGNPLALVELARTLPSEAGARDSLSPPPTTLTARLERAFARRLNEIPDRTRVVLLAAALDSRASVDEVFECAAIVLRAPPPATALDPAIEAALVDLIDGQIHFRHPLMRSAVRQAASQDEVASMYGALARTVTDPERRLWHRAMSVAGTDETAASELEQHVDAAMRRGAVTVAAAALERAASLTADPGLKGRRLVSAAELAYELGLSDTVSRLIEQAKRLELTSSDEARLSWLREMTSGNVWYEPGAAKTFVTIAQQIAGAGGDANAALRSLVPVAHRSWWTRPRAMTRRYLVEAAQSLGLPEGDPLVLAVMALADPEETGPAVLHVVSRLHLRDVPDPVNAMYVGIAAEKAGDCALGARFLASAIEGLREQVRLGVLTQALVHHAWAAAYAGEWMAASASAAEGAALALDTNQPEFGITGDTIAALVDAMRGANPDIDGILARPERSALALKAGPLLAPAHLARGAAALGEGRHEDAFESLWPVFDETDESFHRFMRWPAVLDLVEAAAGSGQAQRIDGVMADLEAIGVRTGPPILCAGLACARPLLAGDHQSGPLFEAALARDLAAYPFLRARTLFSFGRWLRRQRRSSDARVPLRKSIEVFDALGATVWGTRAREELRATGESIGRRAPDARDRLTAQELQIALLAANGLSNREIAERLFVSHRTVGSHLYHSFPKLGITARTQLRDALKAGAGD